MLDIQRLILVIPAILIAITIHEFSHATAALALGDKTAKWQGRVSLNPLRHLDPLGTIMILFTAIAGFGIGWGRPVPVNPNNLRTGPKTGMALVSFAGPGSNLLTAFLLALPLRDNPLAYGSGTAGDFVMTLIYLSIGLGVFNLIPLPPLDGFAIALGLLPWAAARYLQQLAVYGPGVLLLIIFADSYLRIGILNLVMRPLMMLAETLVFGAILY